MLNLKDILHEILTEDVSPKEVNDAINNKVQVVITYSDDANRAPEKRLIEPYAYGRSKAGNSVFRAFQYDGDTFRGKPKWKLFRLDRVTSWNPTDNHFNSDPKERRWTDKAYNEIGDNSMSTVLNMVKFDYDQTSDNPYEVGSDLYNIRKRTDNLKKSKPINVNQMDNSTVKAGPVTKNGVEKSTNTNTTQRGPITMPNVNDDNFKQMLQRNLDITNKEKEKRGFSLSGNNNQQQNNVENNTENQEEGEFQKMLKRNLDITDKEKARRGFDINKK
ncbi:MAG: WYL domain-containing protein [Bacilli bacterium]|nr:WYL domain-containing protein [Bacilli bacterium]